jgi:hypothetical protein
MESSDAATDHFHCLLERLPITTTRSDCILRAAEVDADCFTNLVLLAVQIFPAGEQ